MCDNFVEIKAGKLIGMNGRFKKGHWILCDTCGIYSLPGKKNCKNCNGGGYINASGIGLPCTFCNIKKIKKSRTARKQ